MSWKMARIIKHACLRISFSLLEIFWVVAWAGSTDQYVSEIKGFCNIIHYTIHNFRVSVFMLTLYFVCVYVGGGGGYIN